MTGLPFDADSLPGGRVGCWIGLIVCIVVCLALLTGLGWCGWWLFKFLVKLAVVS